MVSLFPADLPVLASCPISTPGAAILEVIPISPRRSNLRPRFFGTRGTKSMLARRIGHSKRAPLAEEEKPMRPRQMAHALAHIGRAVHRRRGNYSSSLLHMMGATIAMGTTTTTRTTEIPTSVLNIILHSARRSGPGRKTPQRNETRSNGWRQGTRHKPASGRIVTRRKADAPFCQIGSGASTPARRRRQVHFKRRFGPGMMVPFPTGDQGGPRRKQPRQSAPQPARRRPSDIDSTTHEIDHHETRQPYRNPRNFHRRHADHSHARAG